MFVTSFVIRTLFFLLRLDHPEQADQVLLDPAQVRPVRVSLPGIERLPGDAQPGSLGRDSFEINFQKFFHVVNSIAPALEPGLVRLKKGYPAAGLGGLPGFYYFFIGQA